MDSSLPHTHGKSATPRPARRSEAAAIFSCLVGVPFALSVPALTVLAPLLILGVRAVIDRLKGRPIGNIHPACRRLIFYALLFVAICFCAQISFSVIPNILTEHGMPIKHLLVLLGWGSLLAHLIACGGLIIGAAHAYLLLKKAEE